jgi:(p)ppGpp synthase/HD superfamily hydrolase
MAFETGRRLIAARIAHAERIARRLHAGQFDKGTTPMPYTGHLERVAAGVADEFKPVAWLHDSIEDTEATFESLAAEGVATDIIAAVIILTRVKHETYDHYIGRVLASKNPAALAVKVSDLRDNLRPNGFTRNATKYRAALARIEGTR